jgi:alginate O-acetyltransferase complex protein AlgI
MLFNSYVFIFVFMPIVVLGYYALGHSGRGRNALIWLVACSYFYYGWWNPRYLLLLAATTLVNFFIGRRAGTLWRHDRKSAHRLIALGIVANLAALFYFKYTGFAIRTLDDVFGLSLSVPAIVLPLGISFFTFQKIAYLADVGEDGNAEPRLVHYALFVSFFPQLIAGPIVHPKDVLPQFAREPQRKLDLQLVAMGLTIFAIGLFKKTVLADNIAPFSTAVFDTTAHAVAVSAMDAWGAALAYAMQIYFDFSGYSDMAIGLALLFGIRLPLNFNSPYQATSIIDFWRRWHMTLSRFLRDYLYIPLGGNRNGRVRRYLNLILTMLLGGLWHGANWNFAVWGLLHGVYLLINHVWQALRPTTQSPSLAGLWAGRLTTFFAVVMAWVFFRAPDIRTALRMFKSMAFGHTEAETTVFASTGNGPLLLVILLAIAWTAPNTQAVMGYRPWGAMPNDSPQSKPMGWTPDIPWAIVTIVLMVLGILSISGVSEFIYFQF